MRAHRKAEPRQLRKTARRQRGARTVAELLALDDAAGNRQNVFDGAADFGADQVGGIIRTEGRQADRMGERLGRSLVGAGERHRGR